MSQNPDPGQPHPQQPPTQPYPQQPPAQPHPEQPYPASAPTQSNPRFDPPPWPGPEQTRAQGLPQAPPVPVAYGYGQYGGPPVPAGMFLDQESGLMLPQGTRLASRGRRIGAYFLAIPLLIITLGIGYAVWGLIVWARGQTPALQVLGMRCWRPDDNRVPGFWWMALREVIGGLVESILGIITETASFILMLTTRERKAIHDYIAGTVVLHDPDKVLSGR